MIGTGGNGAVIPVAVVPHGMVQLGPDTKYGGSGYDYNVKTMIAHYEICGLLPIWVLAGEETHTMQGFHSVPMIADTYYKGFGIIMWRKCMKR